MVAFHSDRSPNSGPSDWRAVLRAASASGVRREERRHLAARLERHRMRIADAVLDAVVMRVAKAHLPLTEMAELGQALAAAHVMLEEEL